MNINDAIKRLLRHETYDKLGIPNFTEAEIEEAQVAYEKYFGKRYE